MNLLLIALLLTPTALAYTVTFNEDADSPPLLGTSPCTYGPSYWCYNLTQSSLCSATSHCISTTWSNHAPLPKDDDDVCKICLDMVKQARDQLLSNETQADIKAVLDGSCALIPLSPVATECAKLMDNFIPELIDALASRMDPQLVCKVSGLCNNPRIDALLEENKMSCASCSYYVGKALAKLNTTDAHLQAALLAECGHLGSYSDSCTAAVLSEFGKIQHFLQTSSATEFCQLVGICGESDSNTTALAAYSPTEDLSCDFCKQLVTRVREWLSQNTTREEFDLVVKNLCKSTGKYAEECQDFFGTYGDEVWRLIVDDLDPASFCGRLGVCPGGLTSGGPIWTILPVSGGKLEKLTEPEVLVGPLKKTTDILPTCSLCQFTVTKLIDLIGKNRTKESIESATAKVCHMLPNKYLARCTQFMEDYGDRVIEMILIEGSSHEICAALHLCLFGQTKLPASQSGLLMPGPVLIESSVGGDDPKCVICEYVIQTLAERMKDNATEAEIKAELEQICSRLPKTITKKCTDFVTMYGDMIISFLVQEMDPMQVCTELKLCGGGKRTPCQLCGLARDYYQSQEDAMDVDGVEAVGVVCGGLKEKSECSALLEDYGEYIHQLVREGSGDEACGIVLKEC